MDLSYILSYFNHSVFSLWLRASMQESSKHPVKRALTPTSYNAKVLSHAQNTKLQQHKPCEEDFSMYLQ